MIVYLIVSSYRWAGAGQHYYGRLVCGKERVDVMRKLSATEAAIINQQRGYVMFEAGDGRSSFYQESDVVARAKQIWRRKFPEGTLLVKGGGPTYAEPQEALAGPPKLVAEINAMYQRCEQLGWWGNSYTQATEHNDEMLAMCRRWDEIIEEVNQCKQEIK